MNRTGLHRLFLITTLCSAFVPLAFSQTKTIDPESGSATRRKLEPFVRQLVEHSGAPGVQAVVVKDGKTVWSGSYGDAVLDVPGPRRQAGKQFVIKEVFSNITDNSFTQTIYQGESRSGLKPFATITATRKIVPQGAIGAGSKP